MLPRIIVVAGLSAIAIAASGCSGDSDAEAESPPATTTEQVETQPTVDIATFRAAFKERFGAAGNETWWYGHVTGMKMAHSTLEIATDVERESDSDTDSDTTRAICTAAINFALNSEAGAGIEGVALFGSGGVPMGGCG